MVRLNRLIMMRGAVAILIAVLLSLTIQPVLASLSMTSPQCAEAHLSTMAEAPAIAGYEHIADQENCCSANEFSDQHECGNLCAIPCSTSITADVSFEAASNIVPAHPQYEINYMRMTLQDNTAFIPPPPRT